MASIAVNLGFPISLKVKEVWKFCHLFQENTVIVLLPTPHERFHCMINVLIEALLLPFPPPRLIIFGTLRRSHARVRYAIIARTVLPLIFLLSHW